MSAGLTALQLEGSTHLGSLSLDLDNQWACMKAAGIAGWKMSPSYLDLAVPRILDVLAQHQLRITFFVTGQDAALKTNRETLRTIAEAGHEIASRGFAHNLQLNRQPRSAIAADLARAHGAIAEATGRAPAGFRTPGARLSTALIEVLCDIGYLYDASTLPSLPAALSHGPTGGKLAEGLRSLRPYAWELDGAQLMEVPMTTLPLIRMPFHPSALAPLAALTSLGAKTYFRSALSVCRLARVQPSLMLHPLDFLGQEDVPELAQLPGMRRDLHAKLDLLGELLKSFTAHYEVLTVAQHAALHRASPALHGELPHFAADAFDPEPELPVQRAR